MTANKTEHKKPAVMLSEVEEGGRVVVKFQEF